eukprot:9463904-Ditylum_brightwellii.AAC.1
MEEVDDGLDTLQNVLHNTHFIKNPAFPVMCIIPNYEVSTVYTKKITSNIKELPIRTKQTYSRPPTGAWRCGPPTQIRNQGISNTSSGKRDKTNSLSKSETRSNNEKVGEIKKALDKIKANHTDTLKTINESLIKIAKKIRHKTIN